MIVKARYSHGPGSAKRAKAAIRYVTHRPARDTDGRVTRALFGALDDDVPKATAYALIDAATDRYVYRLIISPGGETAADLRELTRDTMDDLANRLQCDFPWLAVEHRDHSNNDHVHVVAVFDRRLHVDNLRLLRDAAACAHERQLDAFRQPTLEVDRTLEHDRLRSEGQEYDR
jgi:hypothetical protein